MSAFRPLEGGERIEGRFARSEHELLRGLSVQLRELIEQSDGPVHDRLFPRAYLAHTEEQAEEEWQRLMHAELLQAKLQAADVIRSTLDRGGDVESEFVRVVLDADEATSWLQALNDLRLGLGVMLEVTEDLDLAALDPADPKAPALQLYGWLTWLQGELVDAVSTAP